MTDQESSDQESFLSENDEFLSCLSRKSLQEGFWNSELQSELLESNSTFKFYKPNDRETCMAMIDIKRRESIYKHDCYDGCKKRG